MPTRTRLAVAALVAAALALPVASRADEPPKIVVPLGARVRLGGSAGMCDDLSVATITLDGGATVTALKVGSTICSSRTFSGTRLVYRIEVVPPPPDKEQRKQ